VIFASRILLLLTKPLEFFIFSLLLDFSIFNILFLSFIMLELELFVFEFLEDCILFILLFELFIFFVTSLPSFPPRVEFKFVGLLVDFLLFV